MNRKVLPELSARWTGTIAVPGSFTPGFRAAIAGSSHLPIFPLKIRASTRAVQPEVRRRADSRHVVDHHERGDRQRDVHQARVRGQGGGGQEGVGRADVRRARPPRRRCPRPTTSSWCAGSPARTGRGRRVPTGRTAAPSASCRFPPGSGTRRRVPTAAPAAGGLPVRRPAAAGPLPQAVRTTDGSSSRGHGHRGLARAASAERRCAFPASNDTVASPVFDRHAVSKVVAALAH